MAHQLGRHLSHWLMLAPNGEALPNGLVEMLLETSAILPRGMLTGGPADAERMGRNSAATPGPEPTGHRGSARGDSGNAPR